MTSPASASATKLLPIGTVIRVRIAKGLSTRVGKAVILSHIDPTDPKSSYGVWFYPAGDAKAGQGGTVTLVFRKEITRVHGALDDLSERTLRHIDRGLRDFGPSHPVRITASSLRLRKRHARLSGI
ncbi:DUF6409 family protein [Streptomyces sp. NBC_01264]|uniref:DUF6409 family protein n=1 Tax=Streptomyces sp. NBC_01264 TaxID=2903804 RepID=UPI002256B898|nr:DUF6409 family protein [Streptomyces sp. NBC_01264]MCX4784142.1 DUF6409 family protein [Streptomyces sp. NBC_01264]